MHATNCKNLVHNLTVVAFMVVVTVALTAARKSAPQTTAKTQTGTSSMASDHQFATEAAAGGLAEVKLGHLAEERGSNPAVKEFGKRMVTDHSKANDELKSVAMHDNINLPSNPSSADQAEYDRLSKLSGRQFDDAYAKLMVQDHEKDIAEFRKESTSGSNEQLKNFASQTLPTLESHLQQAREMLKTVSAENR
jgi:putative membrane protein